MCMVIKKMPPKKAGDHICDSDDKPLKKIDFEMFVRGAMSSGRAPPPKPKAKKRKGKK